MLPVNQRDLRNARPMSRARCRPSPVCAAHRFRAQYLLDGGQHGIVRILEAQKIQHHGAAPDLADRIGDACARNVRCRAVHRLEQRRKLALRD